MKFEEAVLARRFTIICLIAAVFGMSFASLLVSRPAYGSKLTLGQQCIVGERLHCRQAS